MRQSISRNENPSRTAEQLTFNPAPTALLSQDYLDYGLTRISIRPEPIIHPNMMYVNTIFTNPAHIPKETKTCSETAPGRSPNSNINSGTIC